MSSVVNLIAKEAGIDVVGRLRVRFAAGAVSLCLVSGAVAACSSSGGGGSSASTNAGRVLRVAAYAETTMQPILSTVEKAFAKASGGAKIQWTFGTPTDYLAQLQASKGGSTPYDLVFLDSATAAEAAQLGLLEKIDYGKISAAAQLPNSVKLDDGVGWLYDLFGTCYNTQEFSKLGLSAPTSVQDWFSPKLTGRVALPDPSSVFFEINMIPTAESLGFGMQDAQAAAQKFASIKDAQLYTSSSQLSEQMASGSVWLAGDWINGQCLSLKKKGVPVAFAPLNLSLNGNTYGYNATYDLLTIPQGGQNTDLAYDFINSMLTDQVLVQQSNAFAYTPTLPSAVAELKSSGESEYLVDTQAETVNYVDPTKFDSVLRSWEQAWSNAFGK